MSDSGVCTACGGDLPPADVLGLITCPSCGRVTRLGDTTGAGSSVGPYSSRPAVASTDPADPADPGAAEAPDPVPSVPTAPPSSPPLKGWPAAPVAAPPPGQWDPPAPVAGAPPTPPRPPSAKKQGKGSDGAKTGRRIGCAIVPTILILVFGLVLFSAIRSCDIDDISDAIDNELGPDSSLMALSGSSTVLPNAEGDTEVIALIQDNSGGETVRRVGKIAFGGDASEVVWQSDPVDPNASRVEVAVVGEVLFAGIEDQLLALDADTGETQWSTRLRDKLTIGCEDCFAAVGGRLVVRTTDAYVTAYGPTSTEPIWTKRLNSTGGSISVAKDRLFVVDDPEDTSAVTPVALVDPASGKNIRVTTPSCPRTDQNPWDAELGAGDQIRPVPGSDDVMAVFGFGDSCVVRWEPTSGTIRWTSRLNGLGSLDEDSIVVGPKDLIVSNSSGVMVDVFLPNGKGRLLQLTGDQQATPSQVVGRTLVALTVTTRGTPRGGMAAWDLSTGERLWANTSLGAAQPVSSNAYRTSDALFDGSPRAMIVRAGEGVSVFTFEGTQRTWAVAPVDLATGDLGDEVRRGFASRYDSGTPSITIEGRTTQRLLITIDSLLQTLPISGRGDVVSFPNEG